jgi:hypothetical protein
MQIANVDCFYTPPKGMLPCHVDLDRISNYGKLNFSYGAPNSRMFWYALKPGYELEVEVNSSTAGDYTLPQGSRVSYVHIPLNQCILKESTKIRKPTLINAGQPHSVLNSDNESRWTLCVSFYDASNLSKLLDFEDIADRLSDCITT